MPNNARQSVFDRRRDVRVSTNKRGLIKFGPQGLKLPCTIHDLTARGAGLSVASAFGLPRVFTLAIDGERSGRFCRVAWSEGKKLGVCFE
jgi:hypothetical protein